MLDKDKCKIESPQYKQTQLSIFSSGLGQQRHPLLSGSMMRTKRGEFIGRAKEAINGTRNLGVFCVPKKPLSFTCNRDRRALLP